MATCIPDKPGPGTPASERVVFAALSRLPDPWHVFHSLAWQSSRDGKPGDGEADFVLLHPDRGILILEVKGGGVRVEGNRWFTIDPAGKHPIKNPFEQATASKHALVRYLKQNLDGLPDLALGHAVVFPDLKGDASGFGPGAPPELVVTASDLRQIEDTVARLVEHWEMGSGFGGQFYNVVAMLAPSTHVRRVLADDVTEAGARLLALTEEQKRFLDFCRRTRRALITGSAGTGKTVLAVERTRRLAVEGFRVLLTCFNNPLATHLAQGFGKVDGLTVKSFHQLCRWQIGAAGMPFPDHPTAEWWDEGVVDDLLSAVAETRFEVDAIVVDEGQDFSSSWFEALKLLMADPDDGPMYVFADSHQAIYREDWKPPFDVEPFDLTVNCRNTRPISQVVAGVFGDAVANLGVDGPEPQLLPVTNDEGAVAAIRRVLHTWVNEGKIDPSQVVVLTQRREMADRLREKPLAGLDLRPMGKGGITCETIHRFKGLEADGVILVLDELETDRDRMLAYVGLSRPRSLLVVVGPARAIQDLAPAV